ncbi:hypothetical protein CON36_34120 [Bacillus cereus]|uniref:Uncharacterized protein n=2 Tax=Bacillus cereus group TaxID=86661 RepID=A0A9X6SSM1_BACCE|nr:hypothetical protein [Bacillus cereus]PDZ94391.1 hypothetical protein CON36_34120 [Bacillus cereus]PFJ30549.1 hypothetical protein COJ15_30815 [Bacillus thuringiensis]PGP11976.1 hypothetical protein COA01_34720 [Bacillus cereus]
MHIENYIYFSLIYLFFSLFMIFRFIKEIKTKEKSNNLSFLIAAFGSGLGSISFLLKKGITQIILLDLTIFLILLAGTLSTIKLVKQKKSTKHKQKKFSYKSK